ncbi:MAG: flotillin domain-containing protein [Alphaproteobacteria bacterium]|nr:flotillin domain-containing protein [Alphaproteobacteria bacterium]
MSGETLSSVLIALVILVIAAVIIGYLLYWFYRRSAQGTAFVRTGLGGRKVVHNGGAIVIPLVHAITPVNMNTLRLEVSRSREQGLITQNRMRVDATAEFYVRVAANQEAIAAAAQTLGNRTMDPPALVELLEGKFVDALRRVAAEMTMEELHEKRGEYALRVRDAVGEDLVRNGLELETVSITQLDQTQMEFFNPSNAFDAEGLTRLTQEIEQRKKDRNEIEQDTQIQIRNKNLETEKIGLEIDRESEYARLAQEREVETARAVQRAEIAREQASKNLEGEEAEISAREELERKRIEADLAIDQARIAREKEVERLEIERRKELEIAEQDRSIALAAKSKQRAEKQAEADAALAEAVAAEERIQSAREREIAERRKQVSLVAAEEDAKREGIRLTLSAEAEREAASDRAEAARISAEGEAEAEKIRALGRKIRHEVEAEATRMMNEAQNQLSSEARSAMLRQRLIEKMDSIIRESVKPLENIEGIRILQVEGLSGMAPGASAGNGGGRSPTDEVINSALRYRAQAPLVDHLMREIGIEGGDVQKFADNLIQPRRSELTKLSEGVKTIAGSTESGETPGE